MSLKIIQEKSNNNSSNLTIINNADLKNENTCSLRKINTKNGIVEYKFIDKDKIKKTFHDTVKPTEKSDKFKLNDIKLNFYKRRIKTNVNEIKKSEDFFKLENSVRNYTIKKNKDFLYYRIHGKKINSNNEIHTRNEDIKGLFSFKGDSMKLSQILNNKELNYIDCQPPNYGKSLYILLNKNKNDCIDLMKKENLEKTNYLIHSNLCDKLEQKKKFYLKYRQTFNLNKNIIKKEKDPIIVPSEITTVQNYKSSSEQERSEKNKNNISKLKYFFKMCSTSTAREVVKEFFRLNSIFNEDFYKLEKIDNFRNYIIEEDNNIDYSKNIIDLIKKGIEYKSKDKEIKNNASVKEIKNVISINNIKKFNEVRKNKNKTENSAKIRKRARYYGIDDNGELVNNLNKQISIMKSLSQEKSSSIDNLTKEDLYNIEKDLQQIYNNEFKVKNHTGSLVERLYYHYMEKKLLKQPSEIPKKYHKALEYIILKRLNENEIKEKNLKLELENINNFNCSKKNE